MTVGCKNHEPENNYPADMIIQIGDSVLTKSQVVSKIPVGLNPTDSANLYEAIVQDWIDKRLISDIAAQNLPQKDKIEQMVNEYRNQLITIEYRRLMAKENSAEIPNDSVNAYYTNHLDEFIVEEPLLKGVYLKVPDNAERLEDLSRWIKSGQAEDIDKIEKYGLKEAIQYDYFEDRWIAWRSIADQIPYRIVDPNAFVIQNKDFEVTYNRSAYMLHISDYLSKGDTIPLEYASVQIRNRMMEAGREEYDNRLLKSLYEQAVKDNKIKVGSYVPKKYKK